MRKQQGYKYKKEGVNMQGIIVPIANNMRGRKRKGFKDKNASDKVPVRQMSFHFKLYFFCLFAGNFIEVLTVIGKNYSS
jgi:hypothetical protein